MAIMRQVKHLEPKNLVLLPQDETEYTVLGLARDKRATTHFFIQLRWASQPGGGPENPTKWIRLNGEDHILLAKAPVVSDKLVNLHRSDSTLIGWLVE